MTTWSIREVPVTETPEGAWRMHESNVSKDLPKMLREALATQRHVAEDIGIQEYALRRYQHHVRFAYGGFFLQAHQWRPGARLTFGSLTGAPSWPALARRLVHVMIPPRVLAARQSFRRRLAARRA